MNNEIYTEMRLVYKSKVKMGGVGWSIDGIVIITITLVVVVLFQRIDNQKAEQIALE